MVYKFGFLLLCFLFGFYFRSYGLDIFSVGVVSFFCALGVKLFVEKIDFWIRKILG